MERAVDVVSGIAAGSANVFFCSPLDTIRTRLSVMALFHNYNYQGWKDALLTITQEEGLLALYKGLKPSLLGYCCSWGFYFPIYNGVRSYLKAEGTHSSRASLIGAAVAGTVTSIVTNPIWIVRTQMMAGPDLSHSLLECYQSILKSEGLIGLYKGISASLFGVVHVLVYFPTYEYIKSVFHKEETVPTFLQMVLCSTAPKLVASCFSYPHEVMRARLFLHSNGDKRFKGLLSLASFTLANEGVKGFYAGFSSNLVRIMPSTFITMYTYEIVKSYLTASLRPK